VSVQIRLCAVLLGQMPIPSFEWPYWHALQRLILALALGLFVGLERQRRGKIAGFELSRSRRCSAVWAACSARILL
jgi:hypothetical protein